MQNVSGCQAGISVSWGTSDIGLRAAGRLQNAYGRVCCSTEDPLGKQWALASLDMEASSVTV